MDLDWLWLLNFASGCLGRFVELEGLRFDRAIEVDIEL